MRQKGRTVTAAARPDELDAMTPAQRRVWTELLAVGRPRPRTDPALADALHRRIERATAAAVAHLPPGERLWVNKSALAALECDGRFLDREATPFEWSSASVRGQLVHTAIEVDTEGRRQRDPDEVLAFAWTRFAARGDAAGAFLAGLDGVEADALRAEARKHVIAFRECFPLLPPEAHARTEAPFTVALHGGRVVLKAVPDLVVGRATARHRRMQIFDFKTGMRNASDRHDLRFYALVATLKLGVAPFRIGTYYLDEADWDAEDVDASILESAARALIAKVRRAATLTFQPPEEGSLRLVPGPGCRWCSRAPDCPAGMTTSGNGRATVPAAPGALDVSSGGASGYHAVPDDRRRQGEDDGRRKRHGREGQGHGQGGRWEGDRRLRQGARRRGAAEEGAEGRGGRAREGRSRAA